MKICVYAASSNEVSRVYINAAEEFGKRLAEKGHTLVYGGGANGLMGAVARGAYSAKGDIIGVAPSFFNVDGVLFENCTEFIYTQTMRERKQIMEDNADAFIIVPGGIGTLEEFFEILTLKQLCRHNKPIVIYNIENYYNEINIVMEQAIKKNFVKENCLELYQVTENLEDVFKYIEAPKKEFNDVKELKEG